ncbi:hypothetical protein JYQ62_08595 [Nostoc sp. UHCC 0702]|nr:hypothetical protein JYQ62_08595 [Nostoc sp. UHCC 0702]
MGRNNFVLPFPITNSQLPIPNYQFPITNSQFPISRQKCNFCQNIPIIVHDLFFDGCSNLCK